MKGNNGLIHRGFSMNDYSQHLANYLGRQGYETALSGIQHEADKTEKIGYKRILQNERSGKDNIDDPVEYDLDCAERAAAYINERSKKDGFFFLSFGMKICHKPWPDHKGKVNTAHVMPPFPVYDCQTNREDMADYIYGASIMDRSCGIVIDALKKTGLDKNTILIFTTDHGLPLPLMKCQLYDTGIGVSLMVKYPGNPNAGTATDSLVSQIDIFPTLCDLCNLPKPEWLKGKSMMPIFNKASAKINETIFAEVTYHASYEPKRCVRTERYKLIKHFDYHNFLPPSNTDVGNSKDFLMNAGLFKRPVPREQLFDLWLDPVERINVIDEAGYQDIYQHLSKTLLDWMEETCDPLLNYTYRVPLPAGAKINKLSCVHPYSNEYE